MIRKTFSIFVLILCLGLVMAGCPKKTVVKEEPSVKKAEEPVAEREKAAKLEAEKAAKEARERELVRMKEERLKKEFEKSLVAKKEPGIEGEILESKLLKDIHFDFDKYDIRPVDAEILKGDAALLMK